MEVLVYLCIITSNTCNKYVMKLKLAERKGAEVTIRHRRWQVDAEQVWHRTCWISTRWWSISLELWCSLHNNALIAVHAEIAINLPFNSFTESQPWKSWTTQFLNAMELNFPVGRGTVMHLADLIPFNIISVRKKTLWFCHDSSVITLPVIYVML